MASSTASINGVEKSFLPGARELFMLFLGLPAMLHRFCTNAAKSQGTIDVAALLQKKLAHLRSRTQHDDGIALGLQARLWRGAIVALAPLTGRRPQSSAEHSSCGYPRH